MQFRVSDFDTIRDPFRGHSYLFVRLEVLPVNVESLKFPLGLINVVKECVDAVMEHAANCVLPCMCQDSMALR
jgi:hypothetical protein